MTEKYSTAMCYCYTLPCLNLAFEWQIGKDIELASEDTPLYIGGLATTKCLTGICVFEDLCCALKALPGHRVGATSPPQSLGTNPPLIDGPIATLHSCNSFQGGQLN